MRIVSAARRAASRRNTHCIVRALVGSSRQRELFVVSRMAFAHLDQCLAHRVSRTRSTDMRSDLAYGLQPLTRVAG